MRYLGSIRWIALALAGLAVAAGVSLAASQLVSERIGLAAEPVSAGKELAPPDKAHQATTGDAQHTRHRDGGPPATPTQTTTTTAPPTTTAVPPTTTATPPAPSTVAPTAPSPPSSGSGGEHEGADD